MRWFNRKPRDLIADANAEWDAIRTAEDRQHRDLDGMLIHDLERAMAANVRGSEAHLSRAVPMPLVAAGGWCAPSAAIYDLHDRVPR